jgi:hypothetical protein
MERLLQITDSRKRTTGKNRLAAVVSIGGKGLLLQFKRICNGLPIFVISPTRSLLTLQIIEPVSSSKMRKDYQPWR